MNGKIQVWLSEFNALTNQSLSRHRLQQAAVALNMSFLTAALGIALKQPDWWDIKILLIIPFLSSLLGFYYLHQEFQICAIGLYIRDRIRPKVVELTSDTEIMGWELWDREYKRSLVEPLVFGLSILTLYTIPSIMALAATYQLTLKGDNWIVVAWIAGSVLTVFTIIFWFIWRHHWLGRSSKSVVVKGKEPRRPKSA